MPERISNTKLVALVAGPAVALSLLLLPAPEALSSEAWRLVALTLWMVIWWMTEAVPIPVTALLPIPLMPLLGIADQATVANSYGHPLIFLFLGGFLIAQAMQRWNLHKRIALNIVSIVGTSPQGIIAGFMLATAFLSMWISNTATTMMMLAVGISVIDFVSENINDAKKTRRFGVALLLAVAYSASVGGLGTPIGTVPNGLLVSYLNESHAIAIDFATWMQLGIPIVLLMLPVIWIVLCKIVYPVSDIDIPNAKSVISEQKNALGRLSRGEQIVLVVFLLTALAWVFRSLIVKLTGLSISDTSIALIAASILFVIPTSVERGEFTVDWSVARNVPWGILLLFGGGLALAGAFSSTGLALAIGSAVESLGGFNLAVITLATIICIVFLTEVTSNTATTATFLPILGAIAVGLGYAPTELVIPAAIAASMAFMMPVATPPNAIVFSYDQMHISDMMKAGLLLNVIAIVVIYFALHWLLPLVIL